MWISQKSLKSVGLMFIHGIVLPSLKFFAKTLMPKFGIILLYRTDCIKPFQYLYTHRHITHTQTDRHTHTNFCFISLCK